MSDITQARKALVARILEGEGETSRAQRRAAYENVGLHEPLRTLIDKVATAAHRITDEDMAAVRSSGLREDEIFELVICGAVGQASRQRDAALTALDSATRKDSH